MNKMKQLLLVIIGFVVAAVVIALLLNATKSDLQRQVSDIKEKSMVSAQEESRRNNEEFSFLCVTSSGTGNAFKGYLVNKNGNRFDFTLGSDGVKGSDPGEIFKKAAEQYNSEKAVSFISKTEMDNLQSLVAKIDTSKKFNSKVDESGGGSEISMLYAVKYNNGKESFVKVGAIGYAGDAPTDGSSRVILKFFRRKSE